MRPNGALGIGSEVGTGQIDVTFATKDWRCVWTTRPCLSDLRMSTRLWAVMTKGISTPASSKNRRSEVGNGDEIIDDATSRAFPSGWRAGHRVP